MNLASPSSVRDLLARLDFKPSRILGQNFLIDGNILARIVDLADLSPSDHVLEVGPGLGVLTAPLLERAGRVTAIEKDDLLHAHLALTLAAAPNLTLLHADAMDVNLPGLLAGGITKLVANLPYAIASRLLVDLSIPAARPRRMVVTVQKEVADRLAAQPGSDDYGLLSVLMQLDYAISTKHRISRTCFFPRPQIESAIVVLERRGEREVEGVPDTVFRQTARRCFEHRRKQLGTILRKPDLIAAAGIDPQRRPETLTLADWSRLAIALAAP